MGDLEPVGIISAPYIYVFAWHFVSGVPVALTLLWPTWTRLWTLRLILWFLCDTWTAVAFQVQTMLVVIVIAPRAFVAEPWRLLGLGLLLDYGHGRCDNAFFNSLPSCLRSYGAIAHHLDPSQGAVEGQRK